MNCIWEEMKLWSASIAYRGSENEIAVQAVAELMKA
jgi:hypothetical protein